MSKMTTEFMVAFVAMQAEIPVIGKHTRNAHGKYNYAELAYVCDKVYPVLRRHGFGISQVPDSLDGGPSVRTVLMHVSGGYIEGNYPIQAAGMKSAANTAQQFGSAISYVRRYGLLAIVGAPTDDDDAASVGSDETPEELRDPKDNPTGQFELEGKNPRDDMDKGRTYKSGQKGPQQGQSQDVQQILATKVYNCDICKKEGKPGTQLAFKRVNGKPIFAHWDCYLDSTLTEGA